MSEGTLQLSHEVAVPEQVKQLESQVVIGVTIVAGVSIAFPAIGLSAGLNISIMKVPVVPVAAGLSKSPNFTPNWPQFIACGNIPVILTVVSPPALVPIVQVRVAEEVKILAQVSKTVAPPTLVAETTISVGTVTTT